MSNKDKWTRYDERNKFVGDMNLESYYFQVDVVDELEYITDEEFDNVYKVYQNKVYELDRLFFDRGIDFWSVDDAYPLRDNILFCLSVYVDLANSMIENICEMIKKYSFLFKIPYGYNIILNMIRPYLNLYSFFCNKVRDFSLENEIDDILRNRYIDNIDYFEVNDLLGKDNLFEKDKNIMKRLGFNFNIENKDDKYIIEVDKSNLEKNKTKTLEKR